MPFEAPGESFPKIVRTAQRAYGLNLDDPAYAMHFPEGAAQNLKEAIRCVAAIFGQQGLKYLRNVETIMRENGLAAARGKVDHTLRSQLIEHGTALRNRLLEEDSTEHPLNTPSPVPRNEKGFRRAHTVGGRGVNRRSY